MDQRRDQDKGALKTAARSREDRLKAALRANLRRRKQQDRGRKAQNSPEHATPDSPSQTLVAPDDMG